MSLDRAGLPLHEGPPRIVLADVCVGLEALQEEDLLLGGPEAVCFAVRIVGMRGEAARSLAFKYFALAANQESGLCV